MPERHAETPSTRETIFYNPLYQFIVRLLLGGLTGLYFYLSPIPPAASGNRIVSLTIGLYVLFHVCWWLRFRAAGISHGAIRLANWVDLIAAGLSVMMDPYPLTPTIALVLITVIGNGIQHGLNNFTIVSMNAAFVCLAAIPMHFHLIRQPKPPYPFYFLSIFLLILVHYAFNLVKRIEQLKDQAERLAQRDELTGLMNRRAFLKSAVYLVSLYNRTHLPLVLVFADLDNFKQVNDSMGHDVGDRVLKQLGYLAVNHFRITDIKARYGGDEFVFILTDSHLSDARKVVARFEEQFLDWAKKSGIPVGVSFGMFEADAERVDLDNMMKMVDEALYEEKRRKKGGGPD